jgi:hypothetical protein
MPLPEKFINFFKSIDPFKQYALLERPHKLLALRAAVFLICVMLFAVYAVFNSIIYANTPEPSVLTVEKIPANPQKQLFEFTIMIPMNSTDFFPKDPFPNVYFTPLSKTLTAQSATMRVVNLRLPLVFPFYRFLVYECYTFPVYGTIDPVTQSSVILEFFVARHNSTFKFPVLFSINDDASTRFRELDYEQVFHGANNDMFPVYRVHQPGSPLTAFPMFEDFSKAGPEISVEFTVSKTVTSANVEIFKSMFAPPTYSPTTVVPPPPGFKQPNQRSIVISIRPTVQVITFSPRNIFTLIGSITGIYSTFMAIGGVISGFLWSRMTKDETDQVEKETSSNKTNHASVEMQALNEKQPSMQDMNSRFQHIESQMHTQNNEQILAKADFDSRIKGIEEALESILNLIEDRGSATHHTAPHASRQPTERSGGVVPQQPSPNQPKVVAALAPSRSGGSKGLAPTAQRSGAINQQPGQAARDVLPAAQSLQRSLSKSRGTTAAQSSDVSMRGAV